MGIESFASSHGPAKRGKFTQAPHIAVTQEGVESRLTYGKAASSHSRKGMGKSNIVSIIDKRHKFSWHCCGQFGATLRGFMRRVGSLFLSPLKSWWLCLVPDASPIADLPSTHSVECQLMQPQTNNALDAITPDGTQNRNSRELKRNSCRIFVYDQHTRHCVTFYSSWVYSFSSIVTMRIPILRPSPAKKWDPTSEWLMKSID